MGVGIASTVVTLLISGVLVLVTAGLECRPVVDLGTSRHRAIENVKLGS